MNTTERIRTQLQGAGIEHYRINESRKQSAELFYIKKDLDIVRSTDVSDCTVTVYRDFESGGVKMRGSAAAMIYPDMTESRAFYSRGGRSGKLSELCGNFCGTSREPCALLNRD